MDSLINAAGHALAQGDVLGALNHVALRDDPPALALRAIAIARLGDLDRAKVLLRRAAKGFGVREGVARARCVLAEAEIALACRDLRHPRQALQAAAATLAQHGDHANAGYARLLAARGLLLIGRLDEAAAALGEVDPQVLTPAAQATYDLARGGIAIRRLQIVAARSALQRAARAARQAGVPALEAEADAVRQGLEAPVVRIAGGGASRVGRLEEVEALLATSVLVVDACRRVVHGGGVQVVLTTRPVLFALAKALGEAWPEDATRDQLAARAFRTKRLDDTQRARLRVEIGRLRSALRGVAEIQATAAGFALRPRDHRDVAVLAPLQDGGNAAVAALLSDGEAWSSSALALALGESQRTIQRALEALSARGQARAVGGGRTRRWMRAETSGYSTTLLLPTFLAKPLGRGNEEDLG